MKHLSICIAVVVALSGCDNFDQILKNYCDEHPCPLPDGGMSVVVQDDGGTADAGFDAGTPPANGPMPVITSPANNATVGESVEITFVADPTYVYTCQLDSDAPVSCASGYFFTMPTSGSHVLKLIARDFFSREGSTTVTVNAVLPPTTTITTTLPATIGPTVQFAFTSNDPAATFECKLAPEDANFTACTSPYTSPTLGDASSHTFSVRAKNTDGLVDQSPDTRTFTVSARPAAAFTSPMAGTTGATAVVTFNAVAGGTSYSCSRNGTSPQTFSPCQSGVSTFSFPSEGNYTLTLNTTDSFGRVGSTQVAIFADKTGPNVTIGGTIGTYDTSISLPLSIVPSNEPAGYVFECRHDGTGSFAACASNPVQRTLLRQGSHTLEVRAKDKYGNYGLTATRNWTIQVLSTTVMDIRNNPSGHPNGIRVQIGLNGFQALRATRKTFNRFWVQENRDQNGTYGSDATGNMGLTIYPATGNPNSDGALVPGKRLDVIGTIASMNGNTVLTDATYTLCAACTIVPYDPVSLRDTAAVLSDKYEGMLLDVAGTIPQSSNLPDARCEDYDSCIRPCDSGKPTVMMSYYGSYMATANDNGYFTGVLEDEGTGFQRYVLNIFDYTYASDSCL